MVNVVISALIICGGLGFFVLSELTNVRLRKVALSVHTKLVLTASSTLLAAGTLAFLALEWNNPRTFGDGWPLTDRLLASWFQSVTARTAGFNTIDNGVMTQAALFVTMALMFIGASPGSTGGGVKTTTFSITVAALWATVRGTPDTEVFKRRIPAELVAKAFFVSLIAFLGLNTVAGAVLIIEGRDLLSTLFETTSAFGTVGLSMGQDGSAVSLVGFFSPIGKLLIAAMMFMGRVGPLTLAFALAARTSTPAKVRYPEGKILIG
jgi:trk system potassium uptake protein TrkH